MNRQTITIIVIAAIILVFIGAGVLLYGLAQGGSIPGLGSEPTPTANRFEGFKNVDITPPPSLEELAAELRAEYPQLADLLENPELGSVYKDFYLAYQQGGQETALALAKQRGILNDRDEIVMTLVLNTEDTDNLIAELRAEGVIVTESFRNLVNIAIPVALIEAKIGQENPDLILDRIANLEQVIRIELPTKATIKQSQILGQGVNITFANTWHEQGITGQGVKIGVLDLGFGGYENLLGSELPENVTVNAFGDEYAFDSEVHGTACAEIVHEMAPGAELFLAYYDGSDAAMGQAIAWLMSQNVDIISNSTGSNGLTPMDGSGFAAELVDEAHDAGIFWVNAAGNEAASHYRGQFVDSDGDNLHEFSPGTQTIPFIPFGPGFETTIILSWNDWQKADQDYELILYDAEGNVLGKSEDPQAGEVGNIPAEGFLYEFEDSEIYTLAIENYDGLARGDATFDLFIEGGEMHPDYVTAAASLSSPSDAAGAFAVGAVNWADDVLEFYSSNGPTADGRIKPDLSAPSVVDSASYAPEAFDGTSAAAPHVAGAAALVRQAFPDFSPDEVAAFLQERAIDLGPPGPDNGFGVGRLSLGATPNDASEPEATPPPPENVQATSTPRPPEAAAIGLPGESGGVSSSANGGDDLGGLIVLAGLCFMCFGAILFVGIVMVGLIVMRRR
jgi:subtilisin family serine protease